MGNGGRDGGLSLRTKHDSTNRQVGEKTVAVIVKKKRRKLKSKKKRIMDLQTMKPREGRSWVYGPKEGSMVCR